MNNTNLTYHTPIHVEVEYFHHKQMGLATAQSEANSNQVDQKNVLLDVSKHEIESRLDVGTSPPIASPKNIFMKTES